MQDDDDSKNATLTNKEMLVFMMMQGDSMGSTNQILPLLFLDDENSKLDFKSFFLYSNMLKQGEFDNWKEEKKYLIIVWNIFFSDCSTNTDDQFSNLLPLLILTDEKNNSTSDSLMLMLMMQSMGDSPVGISSMMPFLLMDDKVIFCNNFEFQNFSGQFLSSHKRRDTKRFQILNTIKI